MSLKLYFSMSIAILSTFTLASIGILLIGELLGGIYLIPAIIFATIILLSQWLIAPKIIEVAFKLKPAEEVGYAWLNEVVEEISKASNLKKIPKVYVADTPIANAFAFGNAISGKKIAITKGLISILDKEELKAVIGHEIGHIKHKDIEVMMALSILPAIFYMIGRTIYYSFWFSGMRDRDKSIGILMLIALLSYVLYFLVSLFMLWVSRLREYYADNHAAKTVPEGNMDLAKALIKLQYFNAKVVKEKGPEAKVTAFKALMFTDPEAKPLVATSLEKAIYVEASRKITLGEKVKEIFSTHPLMPKRIRNLIKEAKV